MQRKRYFEQIVKSGLQGSFNFGQRAKETEVDAERKIREFRAWLVVQMERDRRIRAELARVSLLIQQYETECNTRHTDPPILSASDKCVVDNAPQTEKAPRHNRQVLTKILDIAKKELRASTIARQAHANGSISSKQGYPGVYRIVQTVLRRNAKHIFIQLDSGFWDLRARRQKPSTNGLAAPAAPRELARDRLH